MRRDVIRIGCHLPFEPPPAPPSPPPPPRPSPPVGGQELESAVSAAAERAALGATLREVALLRESLPPPPPPSLLDREDQHAAPPPPAPPPPPPPSVTTAGRLISILLIIGFSLIFLLGLALFMGFLGDSLLPKHWILPMRLPSHLREQLERAKPRGPRSGMVKLPVEEPVYGLMVDQDALSAVDENDEDDEDEPAACRAGAGGSSLSLELDDDHALHRHAPTRPARLVSTASTAADHLCTHTQ